MRSNLALALLLVPHVALAYRPFDGTDVAIADPGIIELELGPVSYVDLPRGSPTELPVLTLNAGVANGWETVIDATRTITRSRTSMMRRLSRLRSCSSGSKAPQARRCVRLLS